MTIPTKVVKVDGLFDGEGNAFMVLAKCRKAAKKSGWTDEQWEEFSKVAKSGDFDHLLQTVMKHFEEAGDED